MALVAESRHCVILFCLLLQLGLPLDSGGIGGECSTRQVAVAALGLVARARLGPMAGLSPQLLCAASGQGSTSWNSMEIQSKDKHEAQKDISITNGSRNEGCLPMLELGSWKRCRHHLHISNLTAVQFRKKLT